MTVTRNGDESGNGMRISFSLTELLKFAMMLGPLIAVISYAVTLRQDVRTNAVRITTVQAEVVELRHGVEEFKRAKLIYCLGLKNDTTGTRAPDADC